MTSDQASPDAEPADSVTITSIEELKAFSDPLRQRALQLLADRPHTVKELAAALDVRPTSLYYHIRRLERVGLIRAVETRTVHHLLEQVYRSVGRTFRFERDQVRHGSLSASEVREGFDAVLTMFLFRTEAAIRRGIVAGMTDLLARTPDPRAVMLRTGELRLTPEQAAQVLEQLRTLTQALVDTQSDDPAATAYAFAVAFSPTVPVTDSTEPPSSP